MTIKVYGSLMSQPTRAIVLLCLANKIPYELVFVDISKLDHKKPEFTALNPAGQIPVLDDDGFILPESVSILKYLATSRHLPDHWYPVDVKARARVDYLLDWYHTNIRSNCYVFEKEYSSLVSWKMEPDAVAIRSYEQKMNSSMDLVEESFLKAEEGKGPFLLGSSQPSIADILFASEYAQTQILSQADQERIFTGRDKTKKWLELTEKTLDPHFAEVLKPIADLSRVLEAARNGN
ncbi:hypothetical protein R1sor_019693 [Riccia sorocarpa]|uniref:GST N-terminal domain-containing protein n=1 Tax=Riccia sorocarpa TaxID=122646 RepID=A0ABD3IEC6_9MARC